MSVKTATEHTKGIYFIIREHRIFEEELYVFAAMFCNKAGLPERKRGRE
jgi:hypothetical protein